MQVFDKGSLHGRGYGFYPFMANKSPLPITVQFGIDDRVVQLGPVHEHIVLRELFVASGFQRGGRDALGFVMPDTRDTGLISAATSASGLADAMSTAMPPSSWS